MPIGSVDTEHSSTKFQNLDEQYCNAVLNEIQLSTEIEQSVNQLSKLRTIYFGGGTPSLAPTSTLRSILHAIIQTYGITQPDHINDNIDKPEITIEMDPGTFTKTKLHSILDMGFNRISLGVQSFHDPTLSRIGRVHRKSDILQTIHMIKEEKEEYGYGVDLSIDLISGLPGVSLAQWVETLDFAVNVIKPDHMSVYDLQVEEETRFGKWYNNIDINDDGEDNVHHHPNSSINISSLPQAAKNQDRTQVEVAPLPNANDCAFMYRYAVGYLKSKGYEHYEISSFAKKGKRSKHNSNYWKIGSKWHAVGLGATSCFNGIRYARPRKFSDYIDWVHNQVTNGNQLQIWHQHPHYEENDDNDDDDDDENEELAEIVMTRLRTSEGLDLKWVNDTYGENKVDSILRGLELGLELKLASFDNENTTVKLSSPDGFLFSNTILSSVFAELS